MTGREDRFFDMYKEGLGDFEATPSAHVYSNVRQVLGKKGFFHFTFASFNAYYLGAILAAGALAAGVVSNSGKITADAHTANPSQLQLEEILPTEQEAQATLVAFEEPAAKPCETAPAGKILASAQGISQASHQVSETKQPTAGLTPLEQSIGSTSEESPNSAVESSATKEAATLAVNSAEAEAEAEAADRHQLMDPMAAMEAKTPALEVLGAEIANTDDFVHKITSGSEKITLKIPVKVSKED